MEDCILRKAGSSFPLATLRLRSTVVLSFLAVMLVTGETSPYLGFSLAAASLINLCASLSQYVLKSFYLSVILD